MVARVDAIALVALRFLVATAPMIAIVAARSRTRRLKIDGSLVGAGALIGLALFAGYGFQTIGLEYTSASKAGFITGLSVVLVPVLSTVVLRRPPGPAGLIGVGCATVGLALLTFNPSNGPVFETGDLLVLAGAVSFGLHIVAVAKCAPKFDVPLLVTVQLATVSLAAFAVVAFRALALGHLVALPVSSRDVAGICFLAVFGTTLAFFVQNVAQKFTSPTHVAIVFASEPVFAGVSGWLVLGEVLTAAQYFGAVLILAGMLAAELRLPLRRRLNGAGPSPGTLQASPETARDADSRHD